MLEISTPWSVPGMRELVCVESCRAHVCGHQLARRLHDTIQVQPSLHEIVAPPLVHRMLRRAER
jgi:hypothetical protein